MHKLDFCCLSVAPSLAPINSHGKSKKRIDHDMNGNYLLVRLLVTGQWCGNNEKYAILSVP